MLYSSVHAAAYGHGRTLGLAVTDASAPELKRAGASHGVSVKGVVRWGAAGRAGIVPGDVLSSLDGSPIRSGEGLERMLSDRRAGEKVSLEVHRASAGEKRKRTVEVVLSPVVATDNDSVEASVGAPLSGESGT